MNFKLFGKKAPATVRTYPAPQGAPVTRDYIVEVNGQPVDVYSTPTRYFIRNCEPFVANMEQMNAGPYDGNPCYFGYFDFTGKVRVEITAAWCDSLRSATIHPLSWGMKPEVNGRKVSFILDRPRQLTLIVNDDPLNRTDSSVCQCTRSCSC